MADTVRTLRVVLSAGTEGFERGFAGAAAAVDKLGDKFKALDKSLDTGASRKIADFADSIGSRLQGVGVALSAALTLPITALGGLAIKAAGEFQQTEIAFTTMLGSAERARAFLAEMEAFAARTPFAFPDLVDASKRMLALGFTAEQIIPTLTAIGDAAAGLGGGKDVIDGVTLALGQMSAKGKVSAQEMNQLAERGIPAWDILARTIGVSIPEAMKLAEKGAISAAVAVPSILQGMSERFGGMMEQQSKTLLGQWSTLKDELGFLIRDIGAALLPLATSMVQAFNSVLPYLKAVVQGFSELSPPVQTAVIAVAAFAAALGPALLALGGFSMALSAVIAAGPVLVPILGVLTGAALAFGAAWLAAGGSMDGFIQMFYGGIANLADAAAIVVNRITIGFRALFEVMGKVPGTLGEPFRNAARELQEFNLNLQNTGPNIRTQGKNVAEGFSKTSAEVRKTIANAAALKDAFKSGLDPAAVGLGRVSKEAERAAAETKRLSAQLSGQTAQREVENLAVAFNQLGIQGVADIEALRQKLVQLQKQGAEITDKGLLGVLKGGKIQIPEMPDTLDLGIEITPLDPAILEVGQEKFDAIAAAAAAAGLSTREIEQSLELAGASGDVLQRALASVPVTFGSVMKDTMAGLPQAVLAAFQGGGDVGKSIGSYLGGSILGGLAGENGPLGKGLANIFGKTLGSAFASILPGLGSILGAGLGSLIGKVGKGISNLFGGKEKEVNKLRNSFIESQGGLDALRQKAAAAGVSLDKLFAARDSKKGLQAAIDEITGKLGSWDTAEEAVNDAAQRYGLTIEELGPAFARQQLDEQAAQLLQDYRVLQASGADMNAVIAKMAPNFSTFVQQALAAGQAIPMAMKPMVDQLIQSGQLLDENGEAFTSAEAAGLTFTETLTEGLSRAVSAIEALVAALTGVPPVTIPVHYQAGAAPVPGEPEFARPREYGGTEVGELPSFQAGGIGDFGSGALAILHGREAIIPLDRGGGGPGLGGSTVNVELNIENNPLQTAETVRQMNEHILGLVRRDVGRSLAGAIAAGLA
jgi:tape measure domain-containing protein